MSFDKSLRLLNYAKSELGGYLELYTELDHDFVVGDIVYIIGGYYDNTNELLYINNYSSGTPTKYNPFSVHKHGYEILYIDYTKNSFVIDFQVNPLNIIYPYGTDSNKFGNPQDNVNLAYNTFVSNDMYKDIYVSRTCFIKGRFNKGTINNGVFGNDNQNVIIGKHPNMVAYSSTTDITINHIASKNMELTAGVINSKTDGTNPISKKIKLIEDLTISPINPFAINNVVVGNNNDGYGYNTFETFLHYGDIIINNGVFDNPKNYNIQLFSNATINKFKFGENEPMFGSGCVLDNVIINNSLVLNYTPTTTLIQVNNSKYDTYIDLNVNTFTFDTTPGHIILNVDYDIVANKIWTNGENIHILGFITPNNTTEFNTFNTDLFGTIVSTSYTFGDINSAQIIISCPVLISDWATILLTNPNDYNVNNLKITFINNNANNIFFQNGNNIATYSKLWTFTIDDNNNILYGYYDAITYTNSVNVSSSNIGLITILNNSKQLVKNINNIPSLSYTFINGTIYKTSGKFKYSKIIGGIFYNGLIEYTHVIPDMFDIYLDNMTLLNGARVESNVYWNDVNIQFYGEISTGVAFETISYLGERKTPWSTEDTINLPMTLTSKSSELNKITGTRGIDLSYYTSQYKVDSLPMSHMNHYELTVELPNLMNTQIPLDNTKKCAIINNGTMYYNFGAWYLNTEVKNPLYFNTIPTAVMNRSNNITSGTYTKFTGVPLPPVNASDIVRVDDNWVYNDTNYYYPTTTTTKQNDISINVYDIIPTPINFPDPNNNIPETLMFLKLDGDSGPDIDNIYDNNITPTAIHNAIYTMYFRQPGIYNDNVMSNAINVPACFIEIEQVKVIKKDLLDVVQSANIYYCDYCQSFTGASGGLQYAWDNICPIVNYPTDYKIIDKNGNPIYIKMTSNDKYEIIVEYWITWFYNETNTTVTLENNPFFKTNYKGGYRTKHQLRHKFEPSNETYNILGESGDDLIDDNSDNIVWI